ncbi:hypothetical protein FB459_2768 [Yimella lutea]|uniref:Uncharacterized protein n=1 Tax=Yimella lutea TaxID=587872 RepID=A0A542EIQ9_9MICO|nr:hypothetical protein FB459_2768 [Yimella lutea]
MAFAATPARPASRAVADKVAREVRNRHHRDSYDFREAAASAVLKLLAGGADEEIPYWAYDHTGSVLGPHLDNADGCGSLGSTLDP